LWIKKTQRTSGVIFNSGTACSMETVVAALIIPAVDEDVSIDRSVTEFLDDIISILSCNL
jgi:hypothetical protein